MSDFTVTKRHTEGKRRTVWIQLGATTYLLYVEPWKRVRIRFKPAGTYGWWYSAKLSEKPSNKVVWFNRRVDPSIGVRKALTLAGLLKEGA